MLSRLRSRLQTWLFRSRQEQDLDDEIVFHLSEEEDERAAADLDPAGARAAAQRDFGNVLLIRENMREVWSRGTLERLVLDTRHAARALVRSPGFSIPAVLTLALGIGATTAMFGAVSAVLLNELPYDDASRIVVLRQTDARDRSLRDGVSAANLRSIAGLSRTLHAIGGAEGPHGLRWMSEGKAVSLRAWLVSEGFFEAIGTRAVLGRTFVASEFVPGNDKVVMLSHRAWQTRFGGDNAIVGREMILDGATHTIAGVLAPDFKYPSVAEVWAPRAASPLDEELRTNAGMDAVGRLTPGTTVAQAQAELDRVAADLASTYPMANADLGLRVISLRQHLVGNMDSPLTMLLCAVCLVLLIASANVAGLQLARAVVRSREYAVRSALGGGLARILRLVLIEGALLAAIGTLLGVGLAYIALDGIRALAPDGIPRLDEIRIDGRVLSFAIVMASISAVVASLSPAVRLSRMDLRAALTEGARGSTGGIRVRRLRDHLVIAEIAMALTLTVGAGLLVRSFERLLGNDLGFTAENRLAVQVWAYDDQHQIPAGFFEQTLERIRALGGVESVGITTDLPLADDRSLLARSGTVRVTLDDAATSIPPAEIAAGFAAIDDGYAATMGIAVRAGRAFSSQDHARSRPVAMVNETFARRYLPDGNAVGRRLTVRGRGDFSAEIVGVLADVRRQGLESTPRPELYVPLSQRPSNGLTFVVKTAADAVTVTAAVERAMWSTDPRQAIWAARPMTDLLWGWMQQRRFNTTLLVSFAVLALGLAAVGVYAIMSFVVRQRASELGIRRALGGNDRDILRLILGRGMRLALTGAAIGVAGSVALTGWLRGMLYDIDPLDPATFVAVTLFVIAVGLISMLLPARRAIQVDAMTALRAD